MSYPQKKPCESESSFNIFDYLHKARNASHWLGHFNDPPSPTDEFDDWLMSANSADPTSNGCCGGGSGGGSVGQKCPFVDVFLYMVLKARQAAAAMAVIMLSAIVIALRSTQFVSGRWTQAFGAKCTISGVQMFCAQAAALLLLNMFVLFTVYWPAYLAFLSITSAMAWVITAIKASVLSVVVFLV